MISNTLEAAQANDMFTHLLVLIGILTLIITVMGVKLTRVWVQRDSLMNTKCLYAYLEQDYERVQSDLRKVRSDQQSTQRAAERHIKELNTTIHNLRAQLKKVQAEGETIKQVSFDSRYGKSHRYTTSGNVERISLKETANTVTVVQRLKEGRGVLHVEHSREDIKGPILKVYAEAE